jgi:vancomycin resistance protein YoaR
MDNKKRLIRIGVLAVPAAIIAIGLGIRFNFLSTDRIAPSVKVSGIELGGLTRDEAAAKLREWSYRRLSDKLTFVAGERRWTGALRDIGVRVDSGAIAREAYSVGRRGGAFTKFREGLGLTVVARNMPLPYKYDWKSIGGLVEKINSAVGVPARDARISFDDGVRTITPDIPGTTVDFDSVSRSIPSAVSRGESSVVLPIVVDKPEVTASDLERVDTLLARYTTSFPAWRRDRTHNVMLAMSRVNGRLIKPGDIFSYNDAVGPRQKKDGFKDALIYVQGKIITGTGGGVCQVSSTVYNVALLANMKILQRSHHSMPVPYVPLGRDATVAYGVLDLKFRNTTSAPVYMTAKSTRSRLIVELYGAGEAKRNVSIVTTHPKRIAKPDGKIITTVTVYRVVNVNGVSTRERVSYDRYLPPAPHPVEPRPKPVSVASRA